MAQPAAGGSSSSSLRLTLGPPANPPQVSPTTTQDCCPTAPVAAPVYVLSADGSHLWLLDSSAKPSDEEPPPYTNSRRPRSSSFNSPRPRRPVGLRSLSYPVPQPQDSAWRSILYGDEIPEQEEAEVDESTPLLVARVSPWKRYWRPLGRKAYWRPLVHLLLINFPFNLLVWPILLAGSLVGTVLLITLPIGAVVIWLTLIIARWAVREEIRLQNSFHRYSHTPRPVFYRLREVEVEDGENVMVWDTRFLRCSWDMFCDYYSYSAVVYFLLIKPLVVFFPTIALVALLPVCVVLFPLLPVYLRAARRYGRWQARVASDNI